MGHISRRRGGGPMDWNDLASAFPADPRLAAPLAALTMGSLPLLVSAARRAATARTAVGLLILGAAEALLYCGAFERAWRALFRWLSHAGSLTRMCEGFAVIQAASWRSRP